MAVVYILYSKSLDKYYTGSCKCLEQRLEEHRQKIFRKAFTSKREDWELYFFVPELNYEQARMMEKHIKSMKSKKYIENLKRYPALITKLMNTYKSAGSSR